LGGLIAPEPGADMNNSCLFHALVLALALAAPVLAQDELPEGAGPEAAWRATSRWDVVDEEATAEIHRHTTDGQYLTPLVSYIPEHAEVPSPRDVLGYIAGTEGRLTRPDDEIRYFEALAEASPRVQLREMGLSEEGRRMILVVVSGDDNMQRLDEIRATTAALADPRATDEQRARELAATGRPIMHITAGLHSPETGSPEMVMELVYRLAVSEHPDIVQIRDKVVLLVTPVTDVDGRARVVDWYYRFLESYDDRRAMPPTSPPYWGAYAFHDNNRDGIQMTLALTRHYNDAFHEWHPTYSLDLHESVPLLYVSTGTGPYNETLDPLTISEWQWIANWEIAELSKQGLPGVWTWGFYTGWNPSYLLWVTNNHNSLGRFYETFGNGSARTMERDLSRATYAGKKVTSRQWYRSAPPPEKLDWSLRNNNNYMQSGVLASLSLTARNADTLLYNFWRKGFNSLARGRDKAPHAWIVPAEQPAQDRLAYLVNQLGRHRIEVHRATADASLDDGEVLAGDYVVRLDQPYGDFARNLLQITKFPTDAEHRPYDDVSWTLGKLYRVDTRPTSDAAILELDGVALVTGPVVPSGALREGRGRIWAVPHDGSNTLTTLRYRLADFEVLAAHEPFTARDRDFPRGTLLLERQTGLEPKLEEALDGLGLEAWPLLEMPDVARHQLDLPRLALYHNWVSTQADGWVRYSFAQAGIDFEYINDDDIRAGGLRERFDVILMAHQGGTSLRTLVHGRDRKYGAQPWTRTEEFPSHGVIDSSPDITGGIGFAGLAELERFLDKDGTLMLLGSAGILATDSGILRGVSHSSQVRTPGSALSTRVVRRDHPVAWGYDDEHWVFRINGPVYTVPEHLEHWIVVQYGTSDRPDENTEEEDSETETETDTDTDTDTDESASADGETGADDEPARAAKSEAMLQTGFISSEKDLEHKAVVLDVPRRAGGRVLLYSFNPLHRHLNHGDHNYLFNALLSWNDFPDPQPDVSPVLAED
jgi:hypothetical protein